MFTNRTRIDWFISISKSLSTPGTSVSFVGAVVETRFVLQSCIGKPPVSSQPNTLSNYPCAEYNHVESINHICVTDTWKTRPWERCQSLRPSERFGSSWTEIPLRTISYCEISIRLNLKINFSNEIRRNSVVIFRIAGRVLKSQLFATTKIRNSSAF